MPFEQSSGQEALDPSSFNTIVRIVTDDGLEIPLWLNTESDTPKSLNASGVSNGGVDLGEISNMDLPIVESVEIDLNLGLNGKLTVSIAAPYDLGLALLNSPIFKIGNLLEAQIIYPKSGRGTPWFSVEMSKPGIKISPEDGLTATLNGEGGAFASMRGNSSRTYTGSYRTAVEQIAEIHGWKTVLPDVDLSQELDKDRGNFSQSNYSDWRFLQSICRWSSCDAYMGYNQDGDGGDALYIRRRKDDSSAKPLRTFVMRGQPDFVNVFPLLDFESDSTGVWLPGAASNVVSSDIDPDSKEELSVVADNSNLDEEATDEKRLGDGSIKIEGKTISMLSKTGSTEFGERVCVSPRDTLRTPDSVVKAHHGEATIRGAINASWSSFAIPEMFPGELVDVSGIGVLDSTYRVVGITHRALAGEWSMRVQAMNNAAAEKFMANALSLDPPKVNKQPGPEETDAFARLDESSTVEVEILGQ